MEIAIDEALGVDDDYTCELSANNDPFEADSRCQSAMSELAYLEAKQSKWETRAARRHQSHRTSFMQNNTERPLALTPSQTGNDAAYPR